MTWIFLIACVCVITQIVWPDFLFVLFHSSFLTSRALFVRVERGDLGAASPQWGGWWLQCCWAASRSPIRKVSCRRWPCGDRNIDTMRVVKFTNNPDVENDKNIRLHFRLKTSSYLRCFQPCSWVNLDWTREKNDNDTDRTGQLHHMHFFVCFPW